MRIAGKPIPEPTPEPVVFPRGSHFEGDKEVQDDLVFMCRAVLDYTEFDSICPVPSPPKTAKPGQAAQVDISNPDYIKKINEYGLHQQNWTIIQSLLATEDLEWEQVKLNDPSTWKLWNQELKASGLTLGEIVKLQQTVFIVNGLDDRLMNEARLRFLASRRQQPNQ